MKVYISGPITGRKTDDYMKQFTAVEMRLRATGYKPVNPARMNYHLPAEVTSDEEYMIVSIAQLSISDAIIMLKGWQDSAGCEEELHYAIAHEMPVMFESTFMGDEVA